MILIEKMTTV